MTTNRSAQQDCRQQLDQRVRAEYIAGADEEWGNRTGRPMTTEEFERVLRR